MTASFHLVAGPAGSGKTQRLIARAREDLRRDPGSVLWLAPTRRALAGARARFLGQGGAAGLRLRTFAELALEILADEGPGWVPSAAQRRLLVEEVVAELHAHGELKHFGPVCDTAGFTEALQGMLADLQRGGVSAAALARAAYRKGCAGPAVARRIGGAAVGPADRERARLFARYLHAQRTLHWRDEAALEGLAAGVLSRHAATPFDEVRTVYLDGFSDFTPGQHALVDALAGRGVGVWVSLADEPGDERAELFAGPRRTRHALQRFSPVVEEPAPPPEQLPAGLAHLRRQLFRPLRRVVQGDDAAGLAFIEAPGLLGEVRLVARRVKTLLAGTPAGEVLVVARDLGPYGGLLREVFAEYGLPLALGLPGDAVLRDPGVALLLRALRLGDDDFPFAGVTALLRHTFFRPAWPEAAGETPQRAEALLRLLGEPRGAAAYLAAVGRWAEQVQAGLEDEAAEESRRQKIHELSVACQPFLRRFFAAWDGAPARASLAEHLAWVRRFSDDLGILVEGRAFETFWREADAWQGRIAGVVLDRRTFLRRLTALAAAASVPHPTRQLESCDEGAPGRVRALSAGEARHLPCDHVFLLGLGERGFPRPAGEPSLLEEADRAALGLPAGDDLAGEMLLFYQVCCAARRQLVLSFPASDERGQEMLPGPFLLAVRDCFAEGAVPTERRRMLIEGYADDVPLCDAEYRVRVGAAWPAGSGELADDLRANLAGAAEAARQRFRTAEHGPYDGRFRDPLLVEWVGKQFGPHRVFSPTALEDYVACPFRFLLGHVLHLQPLEEPSEEIQVTRRGMAFHRALARLHQRLQAAGLHAPTPELESEVLREVAAAVDEDVSRAPSAASKELWRLEGRRLLRSAAKYPAHWGKFLEPWQKRGVTPRPHFFEVDFGLPALDGQPAHEALVVRSGGVEVRLSGRIDRVDLAELEGGLGFWVIDYKTGRSSHYTAGDLAQYRRLQLTLYALAVEGVLLAGSGARPLGLAYWLVTENGPKVVLPGRSAALWLDDGQRWPALREQLIGWVATLAGRIRQGAFPLAPRSELCTQTCPYGQVCRISQSRRIEKAWDLPLPGGETETGPAV